MYKRQREYRWKEHDSLTVRGNKWFRHSQSKGGYPIDFFMEFYGKSFPEAVQLLTGESGEGQTEATTAPPTAFHLPCLLYTSDFTPFRNIMNEYYARDTSRKIRTTFQSKGKSGKHLTGTVIYGYLWNGARDQWLVDPEAADVVKRIFAMTIDGYGPYQIASKLKSEKVLIPSAYLAQHGEGVNKNKTFKDVYGWGSSTICNILEKREYLGHTINFKTRKHFKDKKSHYVPEDEWIIFENTHEAIIDQQTFDLVQKSRGNVRRYPDGWCEAAPLTGLLYCADCGGKMYVHRTNNCKRISQYTCSQFSKVPVGKLCTTQHRINEDVLLSLVSEMLKAIAEYAKHDRAEFVRVVQEAQSSQQTAEVMFM